MIFYEADTYTYYDQSLMSRPPYLTEEKQAQVLNILTDVSWTSDDKVNGLIALFSDSYDARDVEGSRSYIAGLLEQLRSDREMQHRFEAFWDSVNSVQTLSLEAITNDPSIERIPPSSSGKEWSKAQREIVAEMGQGKTHSDITANMTREAELRNVRLVWSKIHLAHRIRLCTSYTSKHNAGGPAAVLKGISEDLQSLLEKPDPTENDVETLEYIRTFVSDAEKQQVVRPSLLRVLRRLMSPTLE